MFLKKTSFSFPVTELQPLLKYVQWDDKNRCSLNYKTGNWLYDNYKVYDFWKNTEFDKLLNSIPYDIGEARLMRLDPGVCYRSHADADDRLHINIQSNPYSFLIDLDNSVMHRLEEDNFLYWMDGSYIHTAANFGCTPRIQLVIRVKLHRNNLHSMNKVSIHFDNAPYNLRYLVDHSISPLINQMCKTGDIGFFNLVNEKELYFEIKEESLETLTNELGNNKIEFRLETKHEH